MTGKEETNKWTKLWHCGLDVDFTQDKEIRECQLFNIFCSWLPHLFFFQISADNFCLFFNCVFEIATGRDFYNVSRLAMNSNLYILYLCGLIEWHPPPKNGSPLSVRPKDCYKEWTAYLFFSVSSFKLFMQSFVENNSHYCTICNYSEFHNEKEYMNKVKQHIYVKRSVFVIILVRLLWQILSPLGPCPHSKSVPQWALCKQYSTIRKLRLCSTLECLRHLYKRREKERISSSDRNSTVTTETALLSGIVNSTHRPPFICLFV